MVSEAWHFLLQHIRFSENGFPHQVFCLMMLSKKGASWHRFNITVLTKCFLHHWLTIHGTLSRMMCDCISKNVCVKVKYKGNVLIHVFNPWFSDVFGANTSCLYTYLYKYTWYYSTHKWDIRAYTWTDPTSTQRSRRRDIVFGSLRWFPNKCDWRLSQLSQSFSVCQKILVFSWLLKSWLWGRW